MGKVVFECETVTPLFMYGADGKTPELRPASIKGLMRFWWRAMNGDLPLDKLREQEAEIFGNTEKKSKLIIFPIEIINEENYQISLTPHHRKGYCSKSKNNCYNFNESTGICKKANKKTGKLYTFKIQMLLKNNPYLNNKQLTDLFKIVTTLGGFGQRSRRGFGSIKINRISGDEVLTSLNEVEDFINNISTFENSQVNYPYIKNIKIDKNLSENNYFKLLEKIGKTSHKYSDNMFGSGNPRYASPLYISVIRINDRYIPIFTTLHNAKYIDADKLEQFKRLSYE